MVECTHQVSELPVQRNGEMRFVDFLYGISAVRRLKIATEESIKRVEQLG